MQETASEAVNAGDSTPAVSTAKNRSSVLLLATERERIRWELSRYMSRTISWSPKRLWRSQNNGHSWSLDDVITDTNHILKSHSLCFRVALRFTRLTRDKKIEIERTHIWLNGYGMSVVNMLEIRFSSLFTYTRWAYNVYLLFVKEKVSVCATDANDFLLLMIKRQSLK